jgi:hypothetical protein
LLQSLAVGAITDSQSEPATGQTPASPDNAPIPGWGLLEVYGNTELDLSAEEQGIALISKSLLDHFDTLSVGSKDDNAERSDAEPNVEIPELTLAGKEQL